MIPSTIPYRLIGAGMALLALIALAWSWHSRGQTIDRLSSYQKSVVSAVTDATVEPDAKGRTKMLTPEAALTAIPALKASLEGALTSLRQITKTTLEEKARADVADQRLNAALAEFDRRYATANKRIQTLQNRPIAASPAEANAAIEQDSKAAWEGWK